MSDFIILTEKNGQLYGWRTPASLQDGEIVRRLSRLDAEKSDNLDDLLTKLNYNEREPTHGIALTIALGPSVLKRLPVDNARVEIGW